MDVNLISAVSIARRLSDPLAELVKIEPKHLGVGMYQHDIGEKVLMESLNEVVTEVVSFVGVDINTASVVILKYAFLSTVSFFPRSFSVNKIQFFIPNRQAHCWHERTTSPKYHQTSHG